MSTSNTFLARDQIYARATAALAQFPGLVVHYDGVDGLDPPPASTEWVRIGIDHDDDGVASLTAVPGRKRYRRSGTAYAQCFAPMAPVAPAPGQKVGLDRALEIACAVRDAFQGGATDSGVWFRRCNARPVGPDKSWYQANASISFEFDEVT